MEKFVPEFTGNIEGYTKNYINRNLWKVDKLYDFDDVMQEAREQFIRTVKRMEANGDEIKNEKHLMSLYKTSFSRHFITLCNRSTKFSVEKSMCTFLTGDDEDFDLECLFGEEQDVGYLACLLEQAPKEVKSVLNLMFNAPAEILELACKAWNSSNRKSAGEGNVFLCSMLGYDPNKINLVEKVKEYLIQ